MTYRGGKAGSGVYQAIINLMPPHGTYIEAFLGAGAILKAKRPAAFNIGIEIDPKARKRWQRCDIPNFTLEADAMKFLADLSTEIAYMRETRPTFGDDYLIYCDPPYLMSVRSSQQSIYNCEFHSDAEHIALLEILLQMPCMVMISGYDSELYNDMLFDWRKVSFTGVTRGGPRTECVWMNFAEPAELHDYRFLGDDYRKRQDIRRQQDRWKRRLETMPAQKRYAMLSAIEDFKRSRAGTGKEADNRSAAVTA